MNTLVLFALEVLGLYLVFSAMLNKARAELQAEIKQVREEHSRKCLELAQQWNQAPLDDAKAELRAELQAEIDKFRREYSNKCFDLAQQWGKAPKYKSSMFRAPGNTETP